MQGGRKRERKDLSSKSVDILRFDCKQRENASTPRTVYVGKVVDNNRIR